MEFNNFYNFKNPIRHFLNINNVIFSGTENEFTYKDLAHTEPINFRVLKSDNKYRTLKMPNVLNFYCSYNKFKDLKFFSEPHKMDIRKRLVPNTTTGDFVAGVYDEQLEKDFLKLCIYDNLLKFDIKSYYERIYTHHIDFEKDENYIELFLTNLNLGNTNGLIMGNYISLYFAEKFLVQISNDIRETLNSENIDCDFQYFSDDFYFFCNEKDTGKVINIFDSALEKYNLERKEKMEVWTYLNYNEQHVSERYWKRIISESRIRYDEEKKNNNLYFVNQLIYRMSNINEERFQRTFLNTFFKSTFFHELDINKYNIEFHNFHQLCYIFKFSPETLLYSMGKFIRKEIFRSGEFVRFLDIRYRESLESRFNEQQLYFYYALKLLNARKVLRKYRDVVLNSDNQILISYYLKDNLFIKKQLNQLEQNTDEKFWFQNYHLILYTDKINNLQDNIKNYLIPKRANKDRQKKNYLDFYTLNLQMKIPFIKDIKDIFKGIESYRESLVEERVHVFGDYGDDEIES